MKKIICFLKGHQYEKQGIVNLGHEPHKFGIELCFCMRCQTKKWEYDNETLIALKSKF